MYDDGPVFRLIYRSHSLVEAETEREQLGAIFTTARRNNRQLGVTGALVVTDGSFAQVLEGEESAVRDLYRSIGADPRHDSLQILESGMVEGRVFGRWAMAKVAEDGGPDIRLMSNAGRGTIVAAPGSDRSVTAEQEAVLSFMRDSLAPHPA